MPPLAQHSSASLSSSVRSSLLSLIHPARSPAFTPHQTSASESALQLRNSARSQALAADFDASPVGVVHLFGLLCLLAATALLIVVSVSLPVWDVSPPLLDRRAVAVPDPPSPQRVYFLDAAISGSGNLRMGNWGTCMGDVCSKAKLG